MASNIHTLNSSRTVHTTWPYPVVPAPFARQAALACKNRVADDMQSTLQVIDKSFGWKLVLSERMTRLMRDTTISSIQRRLWQILHGNSRATKATTVDAMLASCGFLPNVDLPVPELPGRHLDSREAVAIYLELRDIRLADDDFEQFVAEVDTFTCQVLCHEDWEWVGEELLVPDDEVLKVNNLEFLAQIKELVAWPSS